MHQVHDSTIAQSMLHHGRCVCQLVRARIPAVVAWWQTSLRRLVQGTQHQVPMACWVKDNRDDEVQLHDRLTVQRVMTIYNLSA